ncbi:hypothetical protein H5410_012298 [Solanum commersonii]|uniref:Uncharacterized protein n=1 Tax=Solanum commersonii TaxID=4109 RepID=A0A9J6AR23_SOLCO|nr:hypothetical protein H5410_012298 [Solanum commersonii]
MINIATYTNIPEVLAWLISFPAVRIPIADLEIPPEDQLIVHFSVKKDFNFVIEILAYIFIDGGALECVAV